MVFFGLKNFFTFTNSVDPDELPHYTAFHLGLHCLYKYLLRGFPVIKGLSMKLSVFFYQSVLACFWLSKELFRGDGSFAYPQHMFYLRNTKIIF